MVSTIHVIVVRIIANDDTRVLHHVLDETEAWNLWIRESFIGIGSVFYLHKFRFIYLLFQILIIPHQHLLDLTHVHGVIVTLRITLVDGFLIDDATWLDFCGIDLLADKHQLCSSPAVISIHSSPMRLKGLNFKSL